MTKLNEQGNGGKTKKPSAIGLVTQVGVRPSSRRAKLLTALNRQRNRPIPVRELVKAVYGRKGGGTGPLYMVFTGLTAKMKKARAPFVLRKARVDGNVTYGIFRK